MMVQDGEITQKSPLLVISVRAGMKTGISLRKNVTMEKW